tara:strand:+ start:1091 stop:1483 length:393 start_codon:yes stop_codon:yes gene_type:complete
MKNIILYPILTLTIISLILVSPIQKVFAIGNVDWLLLKENNNGKEWVDLGSIKRLKNNEISVLTKYFENPTKEKTKGETNLYLMQINCISREYKDISINGIPSFKAKWKSSNKDELIDVVIDKSCTEISS